MLYDILLADLKKQYEFSGQLTRNPNWWGLIKGIMNPRFTPIILFRISNYLFIHELKVLARLISLVNFILFGMEIAMRCKIGKGLYIPHTFGIVMGAQSIGENAVIYHGVTIGAQSMDISYSEDKRPIIGNNVVIGSGAKVLGGITVGNNVIIGANAVVTKDISDNMIMGGIPATVIGTRNIEE
ncbi:MAG: serine acetyltransferase [Pelosinus sp.]|jgi:serine O-acetyltransferase|nr:serine acetyltransferase [Pelosinus sp.]